MRAIQVYRDNNLLSTHFKVVEATKKYGVSSTQVLISANRRAVNPQSGLTFRFPEDFDNIYLLTKKGEFVAYRSFDDLLKMGYEKSQINDMLELGAEIGGFCLDIRGDVIKNDKREGM